MAVYLRHTVNRVEIINGNKWGKCEKSISKHKVF